MREISIPRKAGVVDQDVHSPEKVDGLGNQSLYLRRFGDVGDDAVRCELIRLQRAGVAFAPLA